MKNPVIESAREQLRIEERAAGKALRAIPGVGSGPCGLTPDSVRQSAEYRAARDAHLKAFNALRAFNARYKP